VESRWCLTAVPAFDESQHAGGDHPAAQYHSDPIGALRDRISSQRERTKRENNRQRLTNMRIALDKPRLLVFQATPVRGFRLELVDDPGRRAGNDLLEPLQNGRRRQRAAPFRLRHG
jgi:hypothetical protein